MSKGKLINKNAWAEGFLNWEKSNSADNDLLWHKLNQKLRAPRKMKTMNLLWTAAVFFIITGLFIFWNNQSNSEQECFLGFRNPSYVLPNTSFTLTLETATTIISHSPNQATTNKRSNNSNLVNPPLLVDDSSVVKTIQAAVSDSSQIARTNPVIQQKKIRVVHMNEWFSPPPPTFATSKEENEIPFTPSIWPGKHRGLSPPSSNN